MEEKIAAAAETPWHKTGRRANEAHSSNFKGFRGYCAVVEPALDWVQVTGLTCQRAGFGDFSHINDHYKVR